MFRDHILDLIMLGLYSIICEKPCCITHGILAKFAKLGWSLYFPVTCINVLYSLSVGPNINLQSVTAIVKRQLSTPRNPAMN